MAYPASLDDLTSGVPSDGAAPTTPTGDATYPLDDWARATGTAVEAIEAELGLDPAGSEATVVARLDVADTTAAAKVAKSTFAAKGDLLVATAAATPAALTVGTDDYVLTADSAQASGVKWAAASGGTPTLAAPYLASFPYALPGVVVANHSLSWSPSANRTYYMPVRVEDDLTLANLYLTVNSAAGGSSAVVGIFAADTDMQPTGSTLFAASVVDTSTTGLKTISVGSYAWSPGVYLLAINCSGVIGLNAVAGRVPGVNGAWLSSSYLGTPSIISHAHTYDGTLTAQDWDAASSGSNGINYGVVCGFSVAA